MGGKDTKPGINVFRFANRIPLLFEVSRLWQQLQHMPELCCQIPPGVRAALSPTSPQLWAITSGGSSRKDATLLLIPTPAKPQTEQKSGCMQGGSDVITRTATKRINWASYKISQASDKVGVYVSIVSTKIPYKGAGKEYIGADIPLMPLMACASNAVLVSEPQMQCVLY